MTALLDGRWQVEEVGATDPQVVLVRKSADGELGAMACLTGLTRDAVREWAALLYQDVTVGADAPPPARPDVITPNALRRLEAAADSLRSSYDGRLVMLADMVEHIAAQVRAIAEAARRG